MPPDLIPYVVLLTSLIEGRLSAADFATVYVTLFKQDPLMRPGEIYDVLNEIFGAADCYHEDARPGVPMEVSEDDLTQIVVSGIARLEKLLEEPDDDMPVLLPGAIDRRGSGGADVMGPPSSRPMTEPTA